MAVTSLPDPVLALADQCVQCGLCLPTCPTYQSERLEPESPRGRIALARAWALDLQTPSASGDRHLDQCLGCRRCEAVCPAGVRYGALLVAARARQRSRRPASRRQRMVEWLTARPALLARGLSLYRRVFPLLPRAFRPLPRPLPHAALPAAATGTPNAAVFAGCIARGYEGPLHAALARLCAAVGVQLTLPVAQTCCGSLHAHAGAAAQADALAERNRAAFARSGTVLTLASGCHEHVADALRGHAEVADAIAFLAQRADRLRFRPRGVRIALHLPCTQCNVVKSDGALRALLARVPELEIVALDAGTGCCGAAGTQMLEDAARAARLRRPLLDQFAAGGAARLLSANIGCRLHFANATRLPVQHPLEFLAECLP